MCLLMRTKKDLSWVIIKRVIHLLDIFEDCAHLWDTLSTLLNRQVSRKDLLECIHQLLYNVLATGSSAICGVF